MAGSSHPCASRWPPTQLAAVCADHLRYLEGKQYAATTLTVRRVHLRLFCAWAAAQALTEPAGLTRTTLEDYQRYLVHYRTRRGAPLSLASQHARLTHLRVLGVWLVRERHLPENPAADLELPRVGYRLPAVLSAVEVERVLQQPMRVRDRAILETFYSTGMRRMELIRLTLTDLDPTRRLVTIRQGKGRKDRVVPIGQRALVWIAHYLAASRPQCARGLNTDTVFLSHEGKPLTPNYLSGLVREYVDAAQFGKRGACHLF